MLPLQVDRERFLLALEKAKERQKEGIGTQNEKLLHATLKNYFLTDGARAEVPICGFVVDLLSPDGVIEIQTASFSYLKKKLPVLLMEHPVTVLCPLMRQKTLYWVDPQSGTLSKGRKSPKKGQPCHLAGDLFYLSDFIGKEGFRIVIFLYDGEEYKLADGWSRDGKKGSHRIERLPTEPIDFIELSSFYDFGMLLPESCPPTFTAKEFSKYASLKGRRLSGALKLLLHTGAVTRTKEKKEYLYTVMRKEFLNDLQ
jgi:hypothetical protein